MEMFWNVAMIFFALSGAIGWLAVIFLSWYYWMCSRPPQEKL
jgi:hypothetical protein